MAQLSEQVTEMGGGFPSASVSHLYMYMTAEKMFIEPLKRHIKTRYFFLLSRPLVCLRFVQISSPDLKSTFSILPFYISSPLRLHFNFSAQRKVDCRAVHWLDQ